MSLDFEKRKNFMLCLGITKKLINATRYHHTKAIKKAE